MIPAALAAALAATIVVAYGTSWSGMALRPWPLALIGVLTGLAYGRAVWTTALGPNGRTHEGSEGRLVRFAGWLLVAGATWILLVSAAGTGLLPAGGGSDLVHHAMLVDVLARTRHLADPSAGATLGEMAHYTPGLHLMTVVAGSLAGVEPWRALYPLVAASVALKAGFVFLIAARSLAGARGWLPLSLASVAFVLWAPRAYSLDGVLQAGFFAQVGAELFAVAGWWAAVRWWETPRAPWAAFAGLMGAAVFLVWPIWLGPLLLTLVAALVLAPAVDRRSRIAAFMLMTLPSVVVAAMHLWQNAAGLAMAGVSGAVPAFVPGVTGLIVIALATVGLTMTKGVAPVRITGWFVAAIAVQAAALFVVARARGAATPYMAMKMIYLGLYPVAVLAVVGASILTRRLARPAHVAGWALAAIAFAVAARSVALTQIPAPIVSPDLDEAGRWARANLPADQVDYIVDNAEQAYWLHLAVMGQPRATARTADIDGYTTNRAVGRWIEGASLAYAVARRELLPREVWEGVEVLYAAGQAVVIRRRAHDQ